jgi:hypothetical protein
MCVIGEQIYLALIFSNFVPTSSYPKEFLAFKDLIMVVISCVEKNLKTTGGFWFLLH